MFFRNKNVAVVGGGDSAAKAALHLGEFADKVNIFYPEGKLIMEPALQEKLNQNKKIEMNICQGVIEIKGENKVAGIVCKLENKEREIPVEGVFIEIGSVPGVEIAKELGVETDEEGYIIVKSNQETNIPGVYAAGDATTGSNKLRQLITAVAEGSIAASSAYNRLKLKN
jgi:thioredoxin reductase